MDRGGGGGLESRGFTIKLLADRSFGRESNNVSCVVSLLQ